MNSHKGIVNGCRRSHILIDPVNVSIGCHERINMVAFMLKRPLPQLLNVVIPIPQLLNERR